MSESTSPQFAGPCPRCQGPVPNEAFKGEYPGALSRYDNQTYICSDCGTQEAMYQWMNRGAELPGFTKSLFDVYHEDSGDPVADEPEKYDPWNDVEQGRYDDDPSPYAGDYSEE